MSEPKLCKNCNHFKDHFGFYKCHRPISVDSSLITGEVETKSNHEFCEFERGTFIYKDSCGPEGKYFEQRKTFWELVQGLFNSP